MIRKFLLPVILFFTVEANAQSFVNNISTSGLPAGSGEILGVLDYNNDGFQDVVYADFGTSKVSFYRNNKGVFSDVTSFVNFPTISISGDGNESAIPFDYNGDGFMDILLARSGASGGFRLLQNNCGSNFTDVTGTSQVTTSLNIVPQQITNDPMVIISDYDRDNDNDIIISALISGSYQVSVLKNTSGVFASPTALVTSFGSSTIPYIAMFDYDNDLDDDLLVIKNSNVSNAVEIDLYDYSSGSYSIQSGTGLSNSSPVGFATILDYNNDGFDDVLLGTKEIVSPGPTNLGNRVFRNNNGNATFTDVTSSFNTYQSAILGDNYLSHVFDFDNDGDVDILWEVRSNSGGTNAPALRRQTIFGTFTASNGLNALRITASSRNKLVVFDYNNDGKMDVFGEDISGNALMTNITPTANYLKVKLYSCNGHGIPIGSKVYVSAGANGQHKSYNFSQSFTTGAATSNELHFGLGSATVVDTVFIRFQDFANIQLLTNVAANQTLKIVDGTCTIADPLVFEFPTDSNNVCGVSETIIAAPSGFVTYNWSNGETTPDIRVTSEGWYSCTVSNLAGCTATDSIFVGFGNGFVTPSDTTVCKGSTVTLNAFPRFDCSPFGAPARKVVNGQPIVNYQYIGEFNGHHYYLANQATAWEDAAQRALLEGGVLASINSASEQAFIEGNPILNTRNLWLGLYNTRTNNNFLWMNCDTLDFTNWAGGGPSPGVDDHYVFMKANTCPEPGFWKNTVNDPLPGDPCESDIFALVEFDGATNITYNWSTGDTTPSIVVSPTSSNNYFVQINQNGKTCFGNAQVNVINIDNLIPLDSLSECKSSFAFIQATEGLASYTWSNGRTTSGIFVFSNGWYKLTATSAEGCVGRDSIYVTIYNSSIRTPDTTVCVGTTVFLRGPNAPFIFQNDFNENFQAPPFIGWNTLAAINYNGSRVLGPFANDSVTYNQADLPSHDSVMVTFDLYIHDTWEGECSANGKDIFRFKNGLTNVLNATFSNTIGCNQTYSNAGGAGPFPAFQDAVTTGLPKRCDASSTSTTKYTITRKFRHTSTDLNLSWVGDLRDAADNSTKCNESWSIDNVSIFLRRAGGLLWSTGDTTQNIFVTPVDPSTEYWVRVPVGNSFCYDTVVVSTLLGELPHNLLFNDTTRFCGTQGLITVAPRYDSYQWNTGEILNEITPINTGWYTVKASLVQGCFARDSIYVPIHKMRVTPTDTSICLGNSVSIGVNYGNDCSPFGAPANTGYTAGQTIPGYTYKGEFRGHYYYQADAATTWSAAAQSALAAGGHLANVYDIDEQGFLAANFTDNIWLGLYRNETLGYHIWMNCDSLTVSNWANSEPTPSPENYVFMYGSTCAEAGKWKSHVDDPSTLSDPCLTNIFGVLEIEPRTYVYNWYDESFNLISNDEKITVLPSTDTSFLAFHSLFIGGANCNSGTANIKVINENFEIFQDSVEKVSCQGDTVMLVATPGFTNYNWDNGETGQIAVYSNKIGWVYCSYNNGTCEFIDSAYLNVPGPITITKTVTNLKCKGDLDGAVTASVLGGTPPYNFFWDYNGSTDSVQTGLAAGTYTFSVTDQIGCVAFDTVFITEPDTALSLSLKNIRNLSCFADSNAVLIPTILGGEQPYTSTWVGFGVSDTLFNARAGKYVYALTDNRGCVKLDSIVVTEPAKLLVKATISKQIFCADDSNGVVILTAIGGTQPYRYLWNNVASNDTLINISSGKFTATVIDTNGCSSSEQVEMIHSNTNPDLCGVTVSSGFTPNGDGINEFLYIKGIVGYPENELTVFNRWGQTVFSATDYKNDWTGKPNNALIQTADGLVPNDTYFYILKTKSNNRTYSGYIYITR